MDNASIHKSDMIKERISSKINIIWNCPYTPDLNPIEMVFGRWKHLVYNQHSKNDVELIE